MKPIKILKTFFLVKIVTLLLLLLVVVSAGLFIYFFPVHRIVTLVNKRAENYLQQKIEIDAMNYSFRGVKLSGVKIVDPATGDSFASADSVEITFSLAPLLKRKLVLQDLFFENLSLTIEYEDGSYNLEDIFAVQSQDEATLTDTNTEKTDEKSKGFQTTVPNIHLINAKLHIKSMPRALSTLIGSYSVDGHILYKDQSNYIFKEMSIKLPEKRGSLNGNFELQLFENDFAFTGSTTLEDVDIRWTYAFNVDNPPKLPYYLTNGSISELKVTSHFTEGRVKDLRCVLVNGTLIDIDEGYCNVSYTPRVLLLKDIKAKANSSQFELNLLNINFTTMDVAFKASLAQTNIDDVKIMIPPIETLPLRGSLDGTLAFNKGIYNGSLALHNLSFEPYITVYDKTISISDNIFSVQDVKGEVLGTPATIALASLSRKLNRFAFNADFDSFTITQSENAGIPIGGQDILVNGVLTSKELVYENLTFTNTYLTYEYTKEGLLFPRFKTDLSNGTISGRASITRPGKKLKSSLVAQFSNLQLQIFSDYLKEIKNRLYGLASGNLDVSFDPERSIEKSLIGNLSIQIQNGKLLNTGVQNSLGIILNPLKYKIKDLEFNEIYGNVEMSPQGYTINSIMFNSPDIRLSVYGTMDHQNIGNLDMTLLFNNNFIQDIPNFTYPQFQVYKKDEWYIIPLQIKGKNIFDNPGVQIMQ